MEVETALEDASSMAVALYSTEVDKLVKFCFKTERQRATYRSPLPFSSVVLELEVRVHFCFYCGTVCKCAQQETYSRASSCRDTMAQKGPVAVTKSFCVKNPTGRYYTRDKHCQQNDVARKQLGQKHLEAYVTSLSKRVCEKGCDRKIIVAVDSRTSSLKIFCIFCFLTILTLAFAVASLCTLASI